MKSEQKDEEKASSAAKSILQLQYPRKRANPPSTKPNPISNDLPRIGIPNELKVKLTKEDHAMFEKIKQRYGDTLNWFYPDDVLRFVQGYAHEKERDKETFKRIDAFLERGIKEYDFPHILDQAMKGNEEQESLQAWPVFFYGYDNEGHPVMYDEIGNSSPDKLNACFDGKMVKLKTFRFRVLRRLHNTKRIQNMRYGYDSSINDQGGVNGINKHCIVMDIKNFSAKCLTAKYRNLVRDIIGDESNLWPNTLEKMYIVNAPWPFRFAWQIISNFIHPITVAKIDILGSDFINTMKKKIPIDQIPQSYGGQGKYKVKLGYTADIENDILDGDYADQADPIDLNTVNCIRNRQRNSVKSSADKPNINMNDDQKQQEQTEQLEPNLQEQENKNSKEKEKKNEDENEENQLQESKPDAHQSGSDDSYVKVDQSNDENAASKPK